jgi:DNA repair protein RecO (recombination protein O)
MSIIKAEGIIIRSMKMGETSRLLTLFTREHGILKVIAKGSRSRKSRFGGALDLLNVVHIVYYHKESRELQLLSAADIVETFPSLSLNLEKWGYANACGELIIRAHPAAEATPKLYPILLDSLRAMNENSSGNDRACFWGLQTKLLSVFGVPPNLRRCLQCSNVLESVAAQRIYFHVARGGFFCEKCNPGTGAFQLSKETLMNLANLQSQPARKIAPMVFSSQSAHEMEKFLQNYFRFHLEEIGRLQALEFIGELNYS